jgi:RecA-family ATPase
MGRDSLPVRPRRSAPEEGHVMTEPDDYLPSREFIRTEAAKQLARELVNHARAHDLNGAPGPAIIGPDLHPLREVQVDDIISAEIPPTRFVVYPHLPRGFVSLMGSHGGTGKGYVSLSLLAHAASGVSWGALQIELCRCLYVSLEDPSEVVRFRLRRIIEKNRLDAARIAENLRILDGTASEGTLATEAQSNGVRDVIMTPAFDQILEAACDRDFIVIDNASDAFGGDENSRRQVRRFMRALSTIARKNNAAVLLLVHVDKAAARHEASANTYSGSTAWHNSARSRIALTKKDDDSFDLVHEKSNFTKLSDPVTLEWRDDVPVPVSRDVQKLNEERQQSGDAEVILNVIKIAIENGATVHSAMSGPSTVFTALEPYAEYRPYLTKAGRARVKAAVVSLLRAKAITKVSYRDAGRHKRERLELAQSTPVSPRECARASPPIPPTSTSARAGGLALVPSRPSEDDSSGTRALAQTVCPKCLGEGCRWCEPESNQTNAAMPQGD